jgi:hypothetical protein
VAISPAGQTNNSHRQRVASALLLLALLAGLVFDLNWGIYVREEGRALHLASLILEGEVPYRDFFAYNSPGRFYLLAAAFQLLGTNMMACRVLSLVWYLSIVGGLFWLTRKGASAELCVPGAFFMIAWLFDFHGMPMLPATALVLGSCILLHGVFERPVLWRLALAGFLAGLVILLRHFVGFGVLGVQAAVLFVFLRGRSAHEPRSGGPGALAGLATFLAGAGLAVAPAAGYFLTQVPLESLVYQLFTFPLQVYPSSQHLPFPSPLIAWDSNTSLGYWIVDLSARLQLYVPFVALAAGVAMLLVQRRRFPGIPLPPAHWTAILVCSLFLPAFGRMFSRPDKGHLLLALALSNILIALALQWLVTSKRRLAAGALGLLLAAAAVEPCWLKLGQLTALFRPDGLYDMHLPRARGIQRVLAVGKESTLSRAGLYEECIRYIQAHVPPDGHIFVGRERHDRIGWTDNLFYFLAERKCAIRQKVIEHGLTTRPEIQRQMVEDLEKHRVEYIVLANFNLSPEPNDSGRTTGVFLLDQYLAAFFEPVREFGSYVVCRRSIPQAPVSPSPAYGAPEPAPAGLGGNELPSR